MERKKYYWFICAYIQQMCKCLHISSLLHLFLLWTNVLISMCGTLWRHAADAVFVKLFRLVLVTWV